MFKQKPSDLYDKYYMVSDDPRTKEFDMKLKCTVANVDYCSNQFMYDCYLFSVSSATGTDTFLNHSNSHFRTCFRCNRILSSVVNNQYVARVQNSSNSKTGTVDSGVVFRPISISCVGSIS
jgi:hypothetical protein